jgi:glycosyltransferase involved in cell wall biosynthesis
MLYIDVGNTLRGGLRTGIQRVVRSLAFELARDDRLRETASGVRLIAYDPAAERYFALKDPALIRGADNIAQIGRAARAYFDVDAFAQGDIFFEPDSTWTEPLSRGALFRLLKAKGVIVVVLNHDAIPVILPEVCHPNTLIAFAEAIADHIQYSDYALTTSHGVDRDLRKLVKRFLGRSITTRVIRLGADFDTLAPASGGSMEGREDAKFTAAFPELVGLRYLLAVGTIEPRKNHALLLQAFERLRVPDAGLVIVGRKGWMSDAFLAGITSHPDYGKRIFWYTAIDDERLLLLYRQAYASVLPSHYEGYGLPAVEALSQGCVTIASDAGSLPEVTGGHAIIFTSGDGEALFAILDRLYRDSAHHEEAKASARSFRPTGWREAARTVAAALEDVATGASHRFRFPVAADGRVLGKSGAPRSCASIGPQQPRIHRAPPRPHQGRHQGRGRGRRDAPFSGRARHRRCDHRGRRDPGRGSGARGLALQATLRPGGDRPECPRHGRRLARAAARRPRALPAGQRPHRPLLPRRLGLLARGFACSDAL